MSKNLSKNLVIDDNKMINFSKNIILGGRNIIINKFVQI